MKRITIYTAFVASLVLADNAFAQSINWQSLDKEQRHIININAGAEYGSTVGAGYGYQLKSKLPIVLNLELSFPTGDKLTDDFKTKIGGYIRLYQINNFQFSAKIQGVFRRYENSLASLVNFGS